MKIKSKEIKLIDPYSLVGNPENTNKHPKEQLERLEKLIRYQGFREPIIVSNRSGFVVCGHARLEVAKKMGFPEVPVIYQDFTNEAEEYAHLNASNEIARWSDLDIDAVKTKVEELPDLDWEMLGTKFDFTLLDEVKLDDDLETEEKEEKYKIEVTFPNEMERDDCFDDLEHRGFICRKL